MAKAFREQIAPGASIEWDANPTKVMVSHGAGNAREIIVSHPVLPQPLHIDPANPGVLSVNEAASYAYGTAVLGLAGGALYRHLHAALVARFGLTDRHAESIVEAWDARSHNMTPGWPVEPIANA